MSNARGKIVTVTQYDLRQAFERFMKHACKPGQTLLVAELDTAWEKFWTELRPQCSVQDSMKVKE